VGNARRVEYLKGDPLQQVPALLIIVRLESLTTEMRVVIKKKFYDFATRRNTEMQSRMFPFPSKI
jgi:hypothetical protein